MVFDCSVLGIMSGQSMRMRKVDAVLRFACAQAGLRLSLRFAHPYYYYYYSSSS